VPRAGQGEARLVLLAAEEELPQEKMAQLARVEGPVGVEVEVKRGSWQVEEEVRRPWAALWEAVEVVLLGSLYEAAEGEARLV
jgi:hypothetical protein